MKERKPVMAKDTEEKARALARYIAAQPWEVLESALFITVCKYPALSQDLAMKLLALATAIQETRDAHATNPNPGKEVETNGFQNP